jgi:hypothetical protein
MTKYIIYSGLSGCVWGAIAFGVGYWAWGSSIVGGIAIAPLIGIAIGLLFLPAYRLSRLWQFFLSLISLYLAAALFGLGIGLYEAFRRAGADRNGEDVSQAVLATLAGLTILYLFIFLWPLSYLNHRLLSCVDLKRTPIEVGGK